MVKIYKGNNNAKIYRFFENYTKQYLDKTSDEFKRININRKIQHSRRVNLFAVELAEKLNLSSHDIYLINIASLLHDIGRFKQFFEYGTYIDKKSFNHGEEGSHILEQVDVLNTLSLEDRQTIICLVKLHNQSDIQDNLPEEFKQMLYIIQDADRLDWMYALANIIPKMSKEVQDVFFSNKLDTDDISDNMVKDVLNNIRIKKLELQTRGELKIWTICSLLTEYKCKQCLDIIDDNFLIDKIYNLIAPSKQKEIIFNFVLKKLGKQLKI